MPRINYGTSRLYDEYAANINSYVQEVYGMEYYKAIKMCPDLTPAAVKYKLLVETLNSLTVSPQVETIERPTTDEHHGGKNSAPEYTVQDQGQYTEVEGQEEAQVYATA